MHEQNFTEAELAIFARVAEIMDEIRYYEKEIGQCCKRLYGIGSTEHAKSLRQVKAIISEATKLMEV